MEYGQRYKDYGQEVENPQGSEIAGYKFFTQCMIYDDVRDLMLLGTNTGTYAVAKVCHNFSYIHSLRLAPF